MASLQSLLDVKIDRAFLEKHDEPVLVIHGTTDRTIPFSNSEQIVSMLPNATLIPIEGADHSYNTKEHEDAVIKSTVDFLMQN